MHLQLDGQGPIYAQIYRALKALIDDGTLRRGDRVPGSRTLMRDLGVSRNSVLTALHTLQVEGYLEALPGSGTRVGVSIDTLQAPVPLADAPGTAAHGAKARQTVDPRLTLSPALRRAAGFGLAQRLDTHTTVRYDFRYGRVALPGASWKAWSQAHARALRHRGGPRAEAGALGERRLRAAIAGHLKLNRGIDCDPGQILVTNGSQESIFLTLTALLSPGDRLVVEEPGYLPVRAVAELCGATCVPLPVDEQGLCTDALSEPARLVFVTPSHQFPTGALLSAARRQALYAWARRHDALIYEDDYDSEYRYDTRPLPALKSLDGDGRVLHSGSFSKTLYPELRLGFVVLPAALLADVSELKMSVTGPAPTLVQRAMGDFIEGGDYQRHLNRARKVYDQRRRVLLDALATAFGGAAQWQGAQGGIHVFLTLPGVRTRGFVAAAAAAGVACTPVAPSPGRSGLHLALGYGGIEAADIADGIGALARAVSGVD